MIGGNPPRMIQNVKATKESLKRKSNIKSNMGQEFPGCPSG